MYPILVDFGKVTLFGSEWHLRIGSYGAIMLLAIVLGWWLFTRLGRSINPKLEWTDLYFGMIISGVVSAKLLHALVMAPDIASGRYSFWGIIVGGGVWLGGALGGFAYVYLFSRHQGLDIGSVMNALFTALPLAHGVGRFACLMGGCCWGGECDLPWAITYTNPLAAQIMGTPLNVPMHPAPLYEFGLEMINFAICYTLWTQRAAPWRIFAAWTTLYGIERFFLEFIRADFRGGIGPFSTSQLIAIGMVVVGVWVWVQTSGSPRMRLAEASR